MARKLPAEAAERLLDRLCHDDGFRERFRQDPRAALGDIAPAEAADPEGMWMCLSGERLPSVEDLRRKRDLLRSQLTGSGDYVIFNLDTR